MRNMKNNQSGFTLIELVMVIVILGILSAFALPRFADLTGDARSASIGGLAGALKSAAAIAHAQQLADGVSGNTTISLEGASITMLNGYPTANATGIILAANVDTTNDYDASGSGPLVFTIKGYTSASNQCQVSYAAAGSGGIYSVTPIDSDC